MRLFRRRTEFRGLALLALALQLVLSFGHVHVGAAYGARVPSATAALACRTITQPNPGEECPPQKPAETGCAVCWTTAHAGSVVLPEPPAVPPPAPIAGGLSVERDQAAVDDVETASFEARGPPSLRA
jgi:hypothetical protein